MKIELIDNIVKFIAIEDEWKELENQEKETTVFQTYLYNFTWWNTVKNLQNYKLNIFIVRDNDDKLLGIAPLIVEEKKYLGLKINIVKFMGWGDYLNFLILTKNTNPRKIIKFIFDNINRLSIDKIYLTNIDIKTNLGIFLKKNEEYNKKTTFLVECPQIKFEKYQSLDEYKKLFNFSSLNNLRNRLKKDTNYQLIIEENIKNNKFYEISEIHKKLQDRLNLEKNYSERSSLYLNKERKIFLEEFYKTSENIINFFLIDGNGEIIVYESCYLKNNRLINWNMAHNYNYNKYSPGRIINLEIIEWILKEKEFKKYIFDFGCGGYPWKFQWTDNFTAVYKLEYDIQENFKSKIINKLKLIKKGVQCFLKVIKK